jgi:hypothetical protein
MSKKSKALFVLIILALAVSLSAVYLYGRISADESVPEGKVISSKTTDLDLDGDGKKENIQINKYQNGESFDFYLQIKKPFYSYEMQRLSGFEEEADFCENPTIDIGGGERLLCITGYVGVHSQNIQFIGYDGNIKIIPFIKDDKALLSVYSDAPKFEITDENSGQSAKICLMNRNYDMDPLIDTIRECYYFSGERFIYKED